MTPQWSHESAPLDDDRAVAEMGSLGAIKLLRFWEMGRLGWWFQAPSIGVVRWAPLAADSMDEAKREVIINIRARLLVWLSCLPEPTP